MKTLITLLSFSGLYLYGGLAQSTCVPGPTPTPVPSSSPTPTPTATPTASPTPTPTPLPNEEIIIDNLDPGFTIVAGDWGTSTTIDGNGSWGPDFRYHMNDQVNVGIARFTPTFTTAGNYTVYIYWSADPNRTVDQPVIVHDTTGNTTYFVDLQQHGNQWFELGVHNFNVGTGGYIEFNTDTAQIGFCNADAVRLVRN